MGETLDMLKGKMGGELANKEGGGKDPTRELEAAIALVENMEAREVLQAKLREMKASFDLRAREAENRARQLGGDHMVGEKLEPTLQEKIAATAVFLLEKGVDPKVVGDYLTGSRTTTPIALPGMGGTQQGLTIADLTSIINLINQNKPDDGVVELLKTMKEEIKQALKPTSSLDPLQQIEQSVSLVKRLKDVGIFSSPTPTVSGESLEVVKERNRHDEKMEEISTDRDYKEKLVAVVEEIPVSLGKGWAAESASRQGQGGPPSSTPEKQSVSSFQCHNPNCKATIFIPPNPPPQLKCAKCGMIYQQQEQAPAESPSPGAPTSQG